MGYETEQPGSGAWVGFGGSRVTREKAIKVLCRLSNTKTTENFVLLLNLWF
jgi:hypothetical protein